MGAFEDILGATDSAGKSFADILGATQVGGLSFDEILSGKPKQVVTPGEEFVFPIEKHLVPSEVTDITPEFAIGGTIEDIRTEMVPSPEMTEVLRAEAIERDPLVDPVSIVSAAAGGAFAQSFLRSLRAGVPILKSLIGAAGRSTTIGGATAVGELAIATPTSFIEDVSPNAALVANIALGLVSGLTLERALENMFLRRGAVSADIATLVNKTKEALSGENIEAATKLAEAARTDRTILAQIEEITGVSRQPERITESAFGEIVTEAKERIPGISVTPEFSGRAKAAAEVFEIDAAERAARIKDTRAMTLRAELGEERFFEEVVGPEIFAESEETIARLKRVSEETGISHYTDPISTPPKYDPDYDVFPIREHTAPVEENKIFTKEKFDKAIADVKAFFKDTVTLRSGLDPVVFKDLVTIGGYHMERGTREFGKWSKKMITEFGPAIEPHLEEIFKAAGGVTFRVAPKVDIAVRKETFPELVERYNIPAGESFELEKYVGSINLERIDSPDSAKELMRRIQEDNKEVFDNARRGVISHTATQEQAARAGMSEKVLRKLQKGGPGTTLNDSEMFALSMLNKESGDRAGELARLAVEVDSEENIINAMLAIEQHRMIQGLEGAVATESGRAMSARRIIKSGEAITEKNRKAMLNALGGREVTEDIVHRLGSIEPTDTVAVNKFIRDVSQATTRDKVFWVWINSLLSSPVTHAVNTLSNALTLTTRFPEKALSASFDAAHSAVTGKPRTRLMGEVAADVFGAVQGLRVGSRNFLTSLLNDMSIEGTTKLDIDVGRPVKGMKGKIVGVPVRFLVAADEFFKGINYMAELNSLAFRKAALDEGLTGTARRNRISTILANPTEELTQKAIAEARYRTFQKELSPAMRNISAMRLNDDGAWIAMKFIIPFVRTPTNIMKFAVERTPLGFLEVVRKHIHKMPVIDGVSQSDRLARATFGTMLGAVAVNMAAEGKITGFGPDNKAERDALYRTGWRPYSMKVGDTYWSFGRLEPVGSILGMAADFYEGREQLTEDEQANLATLIIRSFGTNLLSKTFIRGLSNALGAMTSPDIYAERFLEGMGATLIPRIVASAARASDPFMRQTEGIFVPPEVLQSQIPGASAWLYPQRDVWGNRKERIGSPAMRFISPVIGSPPKGTIADKEIVRMKLSILPPRDRWMGVKLTREQYDTLGFEGGRTAEKLVFNFINSEFDRVAQTREGRKALEEIGASQSYKQIPDHIKSDIIRKLYSIGVAQARNKLFAIKRDSKNKPEKVLNRKTEYNKARKQIERLEGD